MSSLSVRARLAALALGVPAAALGAQEGPRVVATDTVEGVWLGPGEAVFRGLPYAAPPVGERRWRAPAPAEPRPGLQSAAEFGPACVQSDRLTAFSKSIAAVFHTADRVPSEPLRTSEDCLDLNIWTANLPAPGAARPPVPVMVWIHGGSNLNGSGASPWYDGRALARRGVVVVTINYRLGVFGFLAHPALAAESDDGISGNYGLQDQLEALRWVQRNIAAFGGDPSRVTVFGESAGAIDILYLMSSPASAGLFQRAIAESGPPMGIAPTRALGELQGRMFAQAVGVDTAGNPIAALRRKPAAELLLVAERLLAEGRFQPGPVVDGRLVPGPPGRIFASGKQLAVPLLIGSNAREMTTLRYYLPRVARTLAGYRKWLAATAGPDADALAAAYPASTDAEVEGALIDVVTDLLFTCPSRFAARSAAASGSPAYLYQFTRVVPGGESLGAYHAAEIGYVFGNHLPWLPPPEPADDRLSEAMGSYWTSFAASGRPEGAGLPAWPAYGAADDRALELGSDVVVRSHPKKAICDRADARLPALWGPR